MGPGVRQGTLSLLLQVKCCHSDSAIYCRQPHPGVFSPSATSSSASDSFE